MRKIYEDLYNTTVDVAVDFKKLNDEKNIIPPLTQQQIDDEAVRRRAEQEETLEFYIAQEALPYFPPKKTKTHDEEVADATNKALAVNTKKPASVVIEVAEKSQDEQTSDLTKNITMFGIFSDLIERTIANAVTSIEETAEDVTKACCKQM